MVQFIVIRYGMVIIAIGMAWYCNEWLRMVFEKYPPISTDI
jgi:hypothetical protein